MATPLTHPAAAPEPPKVKIYFLPNLLTAGNLTCGFVALTKIVEADISTGDFTQIKLAMLYIFLACVFDSLDGRVARMGGRESPFGQEFDSLADLISFGVAPAFLVHRIVLKDVFTARPEVGWFIASIYLICGAFRLARFNCMARLSGSGGTKEFQGYPIPSAAGLVASLTYLLISWDEKGFSKGSWKYALPILMLFLSWMMVSEVKYPSFKSLDLRAKRSFARTLLGIILLGGVVIFKEQLLKYLLPLFFTSYLIYGFIRPRISGRLRRGIEEEDDEEEEEEDSSAV
jgi:CDP-diacylglycerol--serine O-phosphatidyltransferase